MMMGVTFIAPPPYLSHDLILPFDAHAAMSEDIFSKDEEPKLPQAVANAPTKFNPAPLVDHSTEATAGAPWEAVRESWTGMPKGQAGVSPARQAELASVVDAWTKAMEWHIDSTAPLTQVRQMTRAVTEGKGREKVVSRPADKGKGKDEDARKGGTGAGGRGGSRTGGGAGGKNITAGGGDDGTREPLVAAVPVTLVSQLEQWYMSPPFIGVTA